MHYWSRTLILGVALLLGSLRSPARATLSEAVDAGIGSSCALTASGGVECWGLNSSGQLGDGTTTSRSTPDYVSGLTSGVRAVAVGGDFACALTATAGSLSESFPSLGVKCWGDNSFGQLGDGTTTDRLTPVDVSGLTSGVLAITAGAGHACALLAPPPSGSTMVKCWGSNTSGQLGDGTTTDRLTPISVVGSADMVAVTAGLDHTCGISLAPGASASFDELDAETEAEGELVYPGTAKCWGGNASGQLGDGTTMNRLTPVDVVVPESLFDITAGNLMTCATAWDGGLFPVRCWGANAAGQLGDGTTTDRLTPVEVPTFINLGGPFAGRLSAGGEHTCAPSTPLLGDGLSARCWGYNGSGELGDGTTTTRLTPVEVGGLQSGIRAISAGGLLGLNHTCALMSGGGIKCWGNNTYGQLGDGTTTNTATPADVAEFDAGCTTMAGTNLLISKLDAGPGNNRLKLRGEMTLPYPFDPPINPVANGVRLAVFNRPPHGAVLEDAIIPGGAYNASTRKGWKVNGAGTVWTYRNVPNDLPSRIYKVKVKLIPHTPGLVKFSAAGKAGSFNVQVRPFVRLTTLFSLESPQALKGQCAVSLGSGSWGPDNCFFNHSITNVRCRPF